MATEITAVSPINAHTPVADCAENMEKLTPGLKVKYKLKQGKTETGLCGIKALITQNLLTKSNTKTIKEIR